jgi:hypothetical protein
VECFTQIAVRLCLSRIRPEEKGQVLARLRGVTVEQQVGQQGLLARLMDSSDQFAIIGEVEVTEELDR